MILVWESQLVGICRWYVKAGELEEDRGKHLESKGDCYGKNPTFLNFVEIRE